MFYIRIVLETNRKIPLEKVVRNVFKGQLFLINLCWGLLRRKTSSSLWQPMYCHCVRSQMTFLGIRVFSALERCSLQGCSAAIPLIMDCHCARSRMTFWEAPWTSGRGNLIARRLSLRHVMDFFMGNPVIFRAQQNVPIVFIGNLENTLDKHPWKGF